MSSVDSTMPAVAAQQPGAGSATSVLDLGDALAEEVCCSLTCRNRVLSSVAARATSCKQHALATSNTRGTQIAGSGSHS
jgi:hypothetical protein